MSERSPSRPERSPSTPSWSVDNETQGSSGPACTLQCYHHHFFRHVMYCAVHTVISYWNSYEADYH